MEGKMPDGNTTQSMTVGRLTLIAFSVQLIPLLFFIFWGSGIQNAFGYDSERFIFGNMVLFLFGIPLVTLIMFFLSMYMVKKPSGQKFMFKIYIVIVLIYLLIIIIGGPEYLKMYTGYDWFSENY